CHEHAGDDDSHRNDQGSGARRRLHQGVPGLRDRRPGFHRERAARAHPPPARGHGQHRPRRDPGLPPRRGRRIRRRGPAHPHGPSGARRPRRGHRERGALPQRDQAPRDELAMPRDLPLGNGDFLVTFDSRYQLRDIFYPNVGQENHTVGEPSRFGVWADGVFAWSGDDGWQRHISYEHETLVGATTLTHPKLGLVLQCRDAVDFDRNLYFKEVTVEDTTGRDREVRLFQHFDAHLYGNDVGDSAYYDPRSQAIVHYKGRRYFLLSGSSGGNAYGLGSFAIGQKDAPGKEGTWRDAEDGELSRNPVAQGSIDSVGMVAITVPAKGTASAVFWIGAGQAYDDVRELDKLVRERTPSAFLARTKDYWR